ncbi:MAG: PqqD family peptide modification chaperone [Anaerocolumna sp.]
MYPQLTEKSFVKQKPDKKAHVYSSFNNHIRGAILINESASSILGLCDGIHSEGDIITILSNKYKEDKNIVKENVQGFLDPFIRCGALKDNKVEILHNKILRGSSEVYYPDILCWEITDYCPLNCRHCYLPNKNNHIISKDDIESILKIIDVMGVYQVQVTGGEALTHPELEYIVDKLISRGLITAVSTSGFNYTDDMLQYLTKLKNVQGSCLRVSLDGNKNTHNYIRRNEGAYDNAMEFIKGACNRGIPCQVGTTVMSQSKQEIEDLVVLAKQLGVYYIEIGMLCSQGNAQKNEILPTWSSKEHSDFLYELSSKYTSRTFTIKLPKETEQKNCGAGYGLIRIRPNLDVTPCPMTEFNLGNLHKNSIFEIMSKCGNVFHDFKFPRDEFCSGCEMEDTCKYCIAQGYNMKDKVEDCHWFKSIKNCLSPFLVN